MTLHWCRCAMMVLLLQLVKLSRPIRDPGSQRAYEHGMCLILIQNSIEKSESWIRCTFRLQLASKLFPSDALGAANILLLEVICPFRQNVASGPT